MGCRSKDVDFLLAGRSTFFQILSPHLSPPIHAAPQLIRLAPGLETLDLAKGCAIDAGAWAALPGLARLAHFHAPPRPADCFLEGGGGNGDDRFASAELLELAVSSVRPLSIGVPLPRPPLPEFIDEDYDEEEEAEYSEAWAAVAEDEAALARLAAGVNARRRAAGREEGCKLTASYRFSFC